jgi:uroporphyrinogen decarboxylase
MAADRTLMRVLGGEALSPPPVWMMRQAGRYLPEYRATRAKAGSFLDLCYNPELATEVTLQPIRRFGFDAAILFSDILVVPHALGRDLRFEEGRGPLMTPITAAQIGGLDGAGVVGRLAPVMEAVSRIRETLPAETTLLGFCGAPWTVATYMIAGHGTPDQAPARLFSYREPEAFAKLLDLLTDVSADYLAAQLMAGADAVQIFDSWAGVLDDASFEAHCVRPVARLVKRLRSIVPEARIIGFPRGAGLRYRGYRASTGVDALGLDWSVPMELARELAADGAVQGNLDPMRLVAGGEALRAGVRAAVDGLAGLPHIFNLGHGVTPETPVEHVAEMVRLVREQGQ